MKDNKHFECDIQKNFIKLKNNISNNNLRTAAP